MGLQKLGITLAEQCARYAKACGKSSILFTKPVHIQSIEGLRYARNLTEDVVQFSRFTRPTETRIAEILKNNGLVPNKLLAKDGSMMLNKFESSLITDNNVLFIEELTKRLPVTKGTINTDLQELLLYLKDIKHTQFADKQAFLDDFMSTVSKVKTMKSTDGKLMFKDNIRGLYSRKAIVEAKYNNPERYREIMDLYKLHQNGKAPRYLMKILFPKSHFHELPKSDIDKLLKGEHYFPRLSNLSETEISKLTIGEAFSVNNEMFVRTASGYEKLKIDKNTYELLFPPIERYAMAQNTLGNCHFISTMDSITKDPNGRIKLYQMFEQTPNGIRCTIPTTESLNATPFDFTLKDIEALKQAEYSVQGSLGHKMLEYTYARNRFIHKNGTATSNKVDDILKIFDKGGDATTIKQYYKELLGVPSNNVQIIEKSRLCGDEILLVNGNEVLASAVKSKTHPRIKCVDNGNEINPNLGLYESHYYNAVDTNKGFIINPWNTLETIPKDPFDMAAITSVSIA